ncbi:MAG: transposase [Nitrospirae bacterium]|nr:transposase [Nitrospirota bacterium]
MCRKYGISDATFYKWRTKYARPGSQRREEESAALSSAALHMLPCDSRVDRQLSAKPGVTRPEMT